MRETDFGRESYDRPKLTKSSSFPRRGQLMQLMQKMSCSSCRRAHAGELMQLMQKSSCRRAHAAELMQLM